MAAVDAHTTDDLLAGALTWMREAAAMPPLRPAEAPVHRGLSLAETALRQILDTHQLGPDGWCVICTRPAETRRPAYGCLTRARVAESLLAPPGYRPPPPGRPGPAAAYWTPPPDR